MPVVPLRDMCRSGSCSSRLHRSAFGGQNARKPAKREACGLVLGCAACWASAFAGAMQSVALGYALLRVALVAGTGFEPVTFRL